MDASQAAADAADRYATHQLELEHRATLAHVRAIAAVAEAIAPTRAYAGDTADHPARPEAGAEGYRVTVCAACGGAIEQQAGTWVHVQATGAAPSSIRDAQRQARQDEAARLRRAATRGGVTAEDLDTRDEVPYPEWLERDPNTGVSA